MVAIVKDSSLNVQEDTVVQNDTTIELSKASIKQPLEATLRSRSYGTEPIAPLLEDQPFANALTLSGEASLLGIAGNRGWSYHSMPSTEIPLARDLAPDPERIMVLTMKGSEVKAGVESNRTDRLTKFLE